MIDYEFYETPETFVKYLFSEVDITGRCFAPCVGNGAIVRAADLVVNKRRSRRWVTNDLDPRWHADYHNDASKECTWHKLMSPPDWTVENPPFEPAIDIIRHALRYSQVGVAMHLRASIHEVLKDGPRRTFMAEHPPTGILWLPRFGYQRSRTTGAWSTDSVCACWVVWLRDRHAPQFIRYAPEWVLDDLKLETPLFRERMDALMGFTGTEAERKAQCIAKFAEAA